MTFTAGSTRAVTCSAMRRVLRQLPVFAVNRNEIPRPYERQHQLQLFGAAMTRHVHVFDALVNHFCAATGEMIHHVSDRLLVARDGAR